MRKWMLLLLAIVMAALCACGAGEQKQAEPRESAAEESAPEQSEAAAAGELRFAAQGVAFGIFDEAGPVLEKLGEPLASFETESCAYEGLDYVYDYDGFEISVNELDGALRITAISLLDDSVATPQGLRIGMPLQEALDAMPMDYREEGRAYRFLSGDVSLTLRVNNGGEIVAIDYFPADN